MNIVFGVCGIGFGHCFRQLPIISHLKEKGHNIILFTFNNSYYFFQNKLPNIPTYNIWAPWIHGSHNGLDFIRTANEKFNLYEGAFERNYSIMGDVLKKYLKIDLFISDYEPITAQFAYATNAPLITIDQQSKYLGYEFPSINGYSPEDERNRLNLFFPYADSRIALSFFKIQNLRSDNKFKVEYLPPLVRSEIINLKQLYFEKQSNEIVVYLSPHSQTTQSLEDLMAVFQSFKNFKFTIYSRSTKPSPYLNILIKSYDFEDFNKDLAKSCAIITTAGHNILTDAIYLEKPVFAIPLETYEQYYNAEIISQNGLGIRNTIIQNNELVFFIKNLKGYKNNIMNCEILNYSNAKNNNILTYLQNEFDI